MEDNRSNENSHAGKWQSGREIENGWMRWAAQGIHFALSEAIKQQCQHNDRDPAGMFLFSFFSIAAGRPGKLSKVRIQTRKKNSLEEKFCYGAAKSRQTAAAALFSLSLSHSLTHCAGARCRCCLFHYEILACEMKNWKAWLPLISEPLALT